MDTKIWSSVLIRKTTKWKLTELKEELSDYNTSYSRFIYRMIKFVRKHKDLWDISE